jgi:phospholipid N-methyltransferase
MPYSSEAFDEEVRQILAILQPRSCLDIGAGTGKYGQFLHQTCPTALSVAVEIEADYVSRFGLTSIYSEVWNIDAQALLQKAPDQVYDLVIFGDSIEHLRKSLGIDLLHFFYYRARIILVLYPVDYLQHSVDGYASEAHVSVWDASDFTWCRHHLMRKDNQCMCFIKGLLDGEGAFERCVEMLHP